MHHFAGWFEHDDDRYAVGPKDFGCIGAVVECDSAKRYIAFLIAFFNYSDFFFSDVYRARQDATKFEESSQLQNALAQGWIQDQRSSVQQPEHNLLQVNCQRLLFLRCNNGGSSFSGWTGRAHGQRYRRSSSSSTRQRWEAPAMHTRTRIQTSWRMELGSRDVMVSRGTGFDGLWFRKLLDVLFL